MIIKLHHKLSLTFHFLSRSCFELHFLWPIFYFDRTYYAFFVLLPLHMALPCFSRYDSDIVQIYLGDGFALFFSFSMYTKIWNFNFKLSFNGQSIIVRGVVYSPLPRRTDWVVSTSRSLNGLVQFLSSRSVIGGRLSDSSDVTMSGLLLPAASSQ